MPRRAGATARNRGPRIAEGKRRSAQNALRHGLQAQKFVLLDDEDAAAFQGLGRRCATSWPDSPLQEVLVAGVALAAWRLRRAERMEVELLDPHLGSMPAGDRAVSASP